MKKAKLILSVCILGLLLAGIGYLFSPAASQHRAERSFHTFLGNSPAVHITSAGCVPDSDGDGYASCTGSGMEMFQCTSSIMSMIPILGSQSCKGQMNEVIKLR